MGFIWFKLFDFYKILQILPVVGGTPTTNMKKHEHRTISKLEGK
jgi:hypothetical protein